MTRNQRRTRRAVTGGLLALALTACGYNAGSNVREISEDDLFDLAQTTTTTTSTTVPTTSSLPTDDTVDPAATTTSSTLPIVTEPVELYFLDGDRLEAVQRNLTSRPSLQRVLNALEEGPGPAGPAGIGLRSAVPEGLTNRPSEAEGAVTVDLDGETFEQLEPNDELPAIAQIVLTLTQRGGVGQVRFTLDDEPLAVRLGNGGISGAGEPVSRDDYTALLADDVLPPTTPPTEPPPPTTEPPTTEPATTTTSSTLPPTTTSRPPTPTTAS